jgi:hypothetical protein
MATANMGLILPTPGVTQALGIAAPGQSWLELLNTALTRIDAHNHAPGFGAPVSSSLATGDFNFADFNAYGLRSARFNSQGSPLGLSTDLGCVYVSGGELYYNDSSGNRVQITAGGSVTGSAGNIAGLVSPASAVYSGGTFSWRQNATTYAYMASGPVTVFNPVSGGFGIQIKPSPSIAASWSLTLPSAPPGAERIMTMDASGTVAATWTVDGATVQVAGGVIGLVAGGVGTTQLANLGVTTAKLADASVTQAKLAAKATTSSSSSSTWTELGLTFVDVTNVTLSAAITGNRPVLVLVTPDGTNSGGMGSVDGVVEFQILRGATVISKFVTNGATGQTQEIPGAFCFDSPGAGTFTYKLQARRITTGATVFVSNMKINVFEL